MLGEATAFQSPPCESRLFAAGNQPARRCLGIASAEVQSSLLPVQARDLVQTPFCTLVEFSIPAISAQADLLLVTPLSGHFAVLARDLVLGLLPYFRVYVMDWINVRHVPAEYGELGLDGNVACVLGFMQALRPGLHVLGLCQGGVPALAATALLAQKNDARLPASLILMGAPIDPLASPTSVVKLLRSKPLAWFEEHSITTVPEDCAGAGRRVYPAHLHLIPLSVYLTRHIGQGSDSGEKVLFDDGADPGQFPFLDLYTSIMDLDAAFFLENTRDVFQECLLRENMLRFKGERVDLGAIRTVPLLTVEGERDDISGLGQTGAAHGLCSALAAGLHHSLVVPRAGHFSLFYGDIWRREVLPVIREFCGVRANASTLPLEHGKA